VTEIPGEVDAEIKLSATIAQIQGELRIAKRIRDSAYNYIWELLGVNAVVTAGDAICKDSVIAPDAAAPGGQRVEVNFAATQTMDWRCYWDIITNYQDYRGKYTLGVICKASGATDTITMMVASWDGSATGAWTQGLTITQTVPIPATKQWSLMDGWTVMSFPIGTYDDTWAGGAGDRLRILIRAATNTGTPTDLLYIAGVYLIPLDESYMIAGMPAYYPPAGLTWHVKNLDGDRGVFLEGATYMRSNLGGVGSYPLLTPEIENYLYFILGRDSELTITDSLIASIEYRPRGIFLRGTNP